MPVPPLTPRPHAVARLRDARLARSAKPFLARGGMKGPRCAGCRIAPSHCICALRPQYTTRSGVCLLMADIEMLKPSNTGWLVADVVPDTFAFGWSRTAVDPALLELLQDPQWQPWVVFPGEFVAPSRAVVQHLPTQLLPPHEEKFARRPLFVLLDATWPEARKMFRKSPYLDRFPVLSLQAAHASCYQLRRSTRPEHFCTSEVAAQCLAQAGDGPAAQALDAWLDVFSHHYLQAKRQLPADLQTAAHHQLLGGADCATL